MVIRMTMMLITTISSTRVNPRAPFRRREPPRPPEALKFRIRCSIGCLLVGLAVNVENILAAKALCLRIVLIAAHAPLVLSGKRIARDAPQELHNLAVGTR